MLLRVCALALSVSSAAFAEAPSSTPSTPSTPAEPAVAEAALPPPPAPTADDINKVTAYYLRGKEGGPILIEFKLCGAIGKTPEGKMACDGELGDTIAKGEPVSAFVRFFSPRGGKYEDLKVKFVHNGEVRSTSDFTVTESWTGYANYKRTTVNKVGTWDVEVLQGDKILAKKSIIAQ
jgi:hypothetical protein